MKQLGILLAVVLGGCGMATNGADAAAPGAPHCDYLAPGSMPGPNGNCASDDECTDGAGPTGWCYRGHCAPDCWDSADLSMCHAANGVCMSLGGNRSVCLPPDGACARDN